MNEQETTRRAFKIGASIVFAVGAISAIFFFYQKGLFDIDGIGTKSSGDIQKSGIYIEQHNMAYLKAIRQADANILNNLPNPDVLKAETTDEVARLFDLSRLAISFGAAEESVAYLMKIVESDSPSAEPFKSAAAFFLLYDAAEDAQMIVDVVNTSTFIQQFRSTAGTVFPEELDIDPERATSRQKARYVTNYLVALSEREDAFAASAKATSLIGSYYIYLIRDPGTDKEILEKYKNLSHTLLSRTVERATNTILSRNFVRGTSSAYDAVAGLDNLAVILSGIKLYNLGALFPEIKDLDPVDILEVAYWIAMNEAPGLDMYTTYLYAVQLAEFSDNSEQNNTTIDALVKRITGVPPFARLNQYSWAITNLINSRENADITYVFRRENLASIARRSPTLREFLTVKDGWTDKDFLLKDSF